EVLETGIFTPNERPVDTLQAGEVGYICANIKNPREVKIGDTVTLHKHPTTKALPGFKEVKPAVFAGIYPVDSVDFEGLRDAFAKLQVNDSALHVEQESSMTLGFGFRCGFLGLLHLEIVFERLRREYDLDVISTVPSVSYRVHLGDGTVRYVDNPAHYPDPGTITSIEEPWVICRVMVPNECMGTLMGLAMEKRGEAINTESVDSRRLLLTYKMPLSEIIVDFNDKLKSLTHGYGSFEYEFDSYQKGDIVKLEIRVNEEPVDAFSCLVHRSKAESKARSLCKRLRDLIPRQLFTVAIQGALGGKILARETLSAMKKDVTAKCYGGDITRKRKLWEKQKKGKEKMRKFGKVPIPHDVFMKVLKSDE
ncbi:MAG: elongation factor 4, partial [Chlamydiia bacterium]|nr:elongation factor 4 [Chlamydiia bacterium]